MYLKFNQAKMMLSEIRIENFGKIVMEKKEYQLKKKLNFYRMIFQADFLLNKTSLIFY